MPAKVVFEHKLTIHCTQCGFDLSIRSATPFIEGSASGYTVNVYGHVCMVPKKYKKLLAAQTGRESDMVKMNPGIFQITKLAPPVDGKPPYVCFGCHAHCAESVTNFVGKTIGLCDKCRPQLNKILRAVDGDLISAVKDPQQLNAARCLLHEMTQEIYRRQWDAKSVKELREEFDNRARKENVYDYWVMVTRGITG